MWGWLESPVTQAILGLAVLSVVILGAYQLILRIRPSTDTSDMNASDLDENFEEMLVEGDIDEAELRRIRSVLGKSQETPS